MSKYVKDNIAAATQQAMTTIPTMIKSPNFTYGEYRKQRITLNTYVLAAVFGAEIKPGKKNPEEFKTTIKHPRANTQEVLELVNLMNDFVTTVERPYLDAIAAQATQNGSEFNDAALIAYIPTFEKIKVKAVKADIAGGKHATSAPIIGMYFTGQQVLELAALAEQVKRIIDRNRAIIIGGIVLASAAAIGGGVYAYNRYQKKKDEEGIICHDDDDIDCIDVDDADDIPVVAVDD